MRIAFTVSGELGHGGDSLVQKIYGHVGAVRHRSALVEYRVSDHADVLRDRLLVLHSSRAAHGSGLDLALSQAQNGTTKGSAISTHDVSHLSARSSDG